MRRKDVSDGSAVRRTVATEAGSEAAAAAAEGRLEAQLEQSQVRGEARIPECVAAPLGLKF